MTHHNVERLIGRLATDEGLRRRFARDATGTVEALIADGLDLNPCERRALLALDTADLERFAEAIDPCIQKAEISGGWT